MMLSFDNVEFHYRNQPVFTNLNFELDYGEFVFVIGKSGIGKSTLMQLIYMNIYPLTGTVRIDEFDSQTIKPSQIPLLRRKVGVIFQDFKLLPDRNVYQNLAYVTKVTGTPSKEAKKKINDVLSEVGLSHKRLNMPAELSGGEQQRVAIARAIINDPILVLADEPTGNLDPETSGEILALLKKINKRGTAVLVVTHNYDIVKKANERIIKLEDGRALKATIKKKE
ncbi:MAG: ATP-binding cassette domain-containing protein [Ignavibacteriaceae bacterium]|jgi:cell division transport system ATP-binding protein|nr:ATP-binding cassette domain-containing protein [Ignavibacteriaceae bacterium]MCW8812948.1 ATP-binding cassette domain-containing protein [Chlorobium sp.]MCW8995937.1 ATP-binding cassette domain-containing protein [Psychromonas sp.]MCW8824528.1 ATP-binding cassette domain-containing protein [Ignavibacteriaceae bacterium]MCW9095166.1 ATP-binding cassette domain-containing protein [Ignavibacteriaceae bacterium]